MREHFESGGELLVVDARHPCLSVRHTLFLLNMPANPARTPTVWQLLVPKELVRAAAEFMGETTFEEITDCSFMEILSLALTPGRDVHLWSDMFDFAERCQVDDLFDYIEETGGRHTFSDRGDLLAMQKVNRLRDQLREPESLVVQAASRAGSVEFEDGSALETAAAASGNFFPGTQDASLSSPPPSRNLPILSLHKDYLQAVFSRLQHFKTTMSTPASPSDSKIKMEEDHEQQSLAAQHQAEEQRARERKKKKKARERARVKRKNMEKKLEALSQHVEASAQGDADPFDLDRAEAKYMLDRAKVWAEKTAALERKYGEAKEAQKAHLAQSRVKLNELLAQAAACAAKLREEMGEAAGDQLLGPDDAPGDHETERRLTPEEDFESNEHHHHQVSTEAIPREAATDLSQETAIPIANVSDETNVVKEYPEGTNVFEGSVPKNEASADTVETGDEEKELKVFESMAHGEEESDSSSLFVRQSAPDTEEDQSGSGPDESESPAPPPSSSLPPPPPPSSSPSPLPTTTTTDVEGIESSVDKEKAEHCPLPSGKLPPMEPALPDLKKLQDLIRRTQGPASTEVDPSAKVLDAGHTNSKSTQELHSPRLRSRTQSVSSASTPLGRAESVAQDTKCEQEDRSESPPSEHIAVQEALATPSPALGTPVQKQVPVIDTHGSPNHQAFVRPVVRLPPATAYLASPKAKLDLRPQTSASALSGRNDGARGGLGHTVPPRVSQVLPPMHPSQQPGLPIWAQQLAHGHHDGIPGHHVNSLPLPGWTPAGVGQSPLHPDSRNGWNFGGPPPPPYYVPDTWQQGPCIPPPPLPQMRPLAIEIPTPQMLGALPPATCQPLPIGPQVIPNIVGAYEPGVHPQFQPPFPQGLPTVRPEARNSSAPGLMTSGDPPSQYTRVASQNLDESTRPTRASHPGFSTPDWLSKNIYPANATVTFKPKSGNESLDGRLSSTMGGVEFEVPAGWLRHLLETKESTWQIETVTVRRRQ